MGMTVNEKVYGSYSDTDLNDWERFPMNEKVLTSSAFGAWLLRRDERRDKAIPKDQYEVRLKADMVAILDKIRAEIEANMESIIGKYDSHTPTRDMPSAKIERNSAREECLQIIDKYKAESEVDNGNDNKQ